MDNTAVRMTIQAGHARATVRAILLLLAGRAANATAGLLFSCAAAQHTLTHPHTVFFQDHRPAQNKEKGERKGTDLLRAKTPNRRFKVRDPAQTRLKYASLPQDQPADRRNQHDARKVPCSTQTTRFSHSFFIAQPLEKNYSLGKQLFLVLLLLHCEFIKCCRAQVGFGSKFSVLPTDSSPASPNQAVLSPPQTQCTLTY